MPQLKLLKLSLLFLLIVSSHAFAKDDAIRLESLIPETASSVFFIENVPDFLHKWADSPMYQFWNSDELKWALAPLRKQIKVDQWDTIVLENTGYTLEDLVKTLVGQVGVVDIKISLTDKGFVISPSMIILEIGQQQEMIKALIAMNWEEQLGLVSAESQVLTSDTEFQGETIHSRQMASGEDIKLLFAYTVVGNFVVFADSLSALQQWITAHKTNGIENSLAQSNAFSRLKQQTSSWDSLFYLNIQPMLPQIKDLISSNKKWESGLTMLQLTPDQLFDTFGINMIEAIYLSYQIENHVTEEKLGLLYKKDTGAIKLLGDAYTSPLELPEFIPTNVLEVAVSHASIANLWQLIQDTGQSLGPNFNVASQLDVISEQAKVDINQALLSGFGDYMIYIESPKPPKWPGQTVLWDSSEMLFAVSVADRQILEQTINGLKQTLFTGFTFEEVAYLDTMLYLARDHSEQSTEKKAEPSRVYALTNDYLFVSTNMSSLQGILAHNQHGGDTIWKNESVHQAIADLPQHAIDISYVKPSRFLAQIAEALIWLQSGVAKAVASEVESEAESEAAVCNVPRKVSQTELENYYAAIIKASYKEDGAYTNITRMIHIEKPQ